LRHTPSTCRDVLPGLPYDHCARFLVHVQTKACALLGDKQGLRETREQHRSGLRLPGDGKRVVSVLPPPAAGCYPNRYLEQDEKRL